MKKKNITIIGGGACGVAVFIDLVLKIKISDLQEKVKITIIEKRKKIGEGMAFGTRQPGHLLNTKTELMGIHACEPDHFSEWLKSRKDAVKEEIVDEQDLENTHTSRRLYGKYLEEQFQDYYKKAKAVDLEVSFVNDTALNISKNKNWQIHLESSKTIHSDHVILAPGTPRPLNYPDLEGLDAYVDFPWPSKPVLDLIPKDEDIGILGSSLSAIDTVMTLVDNGFDKKIFMFSPDGLLPRVQPREETNYERQFLTLSHIHKIIREQLRLPKVTEIFRLYKKEVECYEGRAIKWKSLARSGEFAEKDLDNDIKVAESGGDGLMNVLYALRDEASPIWSLLSVDEKQRFKSWLGNYWTINRHAMPLYNAYRLQELFKARKIFVIPELQNVEYDAQNHRFILEAKGHSSKKLCYLINATGPATQVKEMKSRLLQNLLKEGLIETYEPGGITVNLQNMEILSSKKDTTNLYAVGHILNGLLLDSNSVWFNVKAVDKMCKDIIQKLNNGACTGNL